MKNSEFILPDKIKKIIDGMAYQLDDVGKSDSCVYIFDEMVLKIEKRNARNDETIEVMKFLDGKILVPKVICYEFDENYQYLLMSRITGKMACDEYYLEHPEELLQILADTLKELWSIDTKTCPRIRDIDVELAEAKYQVENNLVDLDDVEPTTFSKDGFKDPFELLEWLKNNKPTYEPVLSHGDFCLPNIFIKNGKLSGLIDLGATGVGDKWRDIALCYRSLRNNFNGTYGGKVYEKFNPDMLFEYLGIKPNYDKIKYYLLLDELF